MPFFKFSFKKILSSFFAIFFIFSAIFFTVPAKEARAQWLVFDASNTIQNTITAVSQVAGHLKEFGLDNIAWAISKQILQQLTAQTVNWINTGFKGNPAYITNPSQFFMNVGDNTVIDALGKNGGILNQLCTPFKAQIRLALVSNYLQQNKIGQCSISTAIRNYDAFTQDFSQGGWEGWFSMTQNLQNNPYGSYLAAQDQLSLEVSNQSSKYKEQLSWGKGFLSYEKCPKNVPYGPPIQTIRPVDDQGNPIENADPLLSVPAVQPAHTSGCETVTPGSVIQDELGKALGSGVDKLEVADELNEIFAALLNQAFKAAVGGIAGGLRGASNSSGGSQSLVSQLETSTTPDPGATPYVPIDTAEIAKQVDEEEAQFQAEHPAPPVTITSPGGQTTPVTPTCAEGADPSTCTPAETPPAGTISVSPNSVTVAPGGNTSITVQIPSASGFASYVYVIVSNCPDKLTCTSNNYVAVNYITITADGTPIPINPDGGSTSVGVKVQPSASPQTFNLDICAVAGPTPWSGTKFDQTCDSNPNHHATVKLTVQ